MGPVGDAGSNAMEPCRHYGWGARPRWAIGATVLGWTAGNTFTQLIRGLYFIPTAEFIRARPHQHADKPAPAPRDRDCPTVRPYVRQASDGDDTPASRVS
jgi:hypothetical protein